MPPRKSRRSTKDQENDKRLHISWNGRGSDLSHDSPSNINRQNASNNGSESNVPIFITNGGYRATSDLRYI